MLVLSSNVTEEKDERVYYSDLDLFKRHISTYGLTDTTEEEKYFSTESKVKSLSLILHTVGSVILKFLHISHVYV